MTKTCCISSCKSFWCPGTELSFFKLPLQNGKLMKKWFDCGLGFRSLAKNARICSNHFAQNDYTVNLKGRKLNKDAVPTIMVTINKNNNLSNLKNFAERNDQFCDKQNKVVFVNLASSLTNVLSQENRNILTANTLNHEIPKKLFCNVAVQTKLEHYKLVERIQELQRRIKKLQDRLRRKNKRVLNINHSIVRLKKGKCTRNIVKLPKFSEFDLQLLENEGFNNQVSKNHKVYTDEMKNFALKLYFCSPRAYEFVRTKINLPHSATLRRWIEDYKQ